MPKIVDHDEQRHLILNECFTLFGQHGYAGVTLRKLARELKISTGAIYHYFDSKEDLFAQTIQYVAERQLETAVAEVTSSDSQYERLTALVRYLIDHDEHLRMLLLLILDAYRQDSSLEQSDILRTALDTFIVAMEENFPAIPSDDARFIIDMLLGVIVRRLLVPAADDYIAHVGWISALMQDRILEKAIVAS